MHRILLPQRTVELGNAEQGERAGYNSATLLETKEKVQCSNFSRPIMCDVLSLTEKCAILASLNQFDFFL